ncbi:hypothetical protein Tco_0815550 [Tanacetum coccineum]
MTGPDITTTNDLLTKLHNKLGYIGIANRSPQHPVNLYAGPTHVTSGTSPTAGPHNSVGPFATLAYPPPCFQQPTQATSYYYTGPNPVSAQQFPSNQPVTQPTAPIQPVIQSVIVGPNALSGQPTNLAHAFTTETLQDFANGAWNMDTGASSYLNNLVISLSTFINSYMYSSVSVGDGHSIPATNTGHSILPTPTKSLHLNNVLITPHIVKSLIFVRENYCTIEFDAFGFSVKDFLTRRLLLRCDSTRDLYLVTTPSPIAHAFLVSQHT